MDYLTNWLNHEVGSSLDIQKKNDMTLAVKVALKPNITNQPNNQSTSSGNPSLVKVLDTFLSDSHRNFIENLYVWRARAYILVTECLQQP